MAERESASHNLLLSSTLRYKALYFKMLFSNLAFVLQTFQLIEKGTFRYFQVLDSVHTIDFFCIDAILSI